MKVPFLELQPAYLELKDEIDEAVARVLASGWYIMGPELEAFEAEFAAYCGVRHAVGVANGLDALHLGLKALGVGPGDEVIVPSNTYIATWLAVSQCGAKPVAVEPDARTHNLDAARIEQALTPRTRVILPVHLYGQPADLEPMLALARRRGLFVLEDAAQAHGARYRGRRIGGHGDLVAWSFYPGKNLGAMGDGGGLTTNDPQLADRLRVLRNYGSRVKYHHEVAGFNSRLDPVQAAILRVKLKHLDAWNARRKAIASRYLQSLDVGKCVLPQVPDGIDPVWHLFVVRHPRRDALQQYLEQNGIGTQVHYPVPPHLQRAYADANGPGATLPIATQLAKEVLSLPIGPQLTGEQVARVIEVLTAAPA